MIDATHAIERAREETEEKNHAAAVRDGAVRMVGAMEALDNALIEIAGEFDVDPDLIERAYKMDGVYILASPTSIAGRLAWLGQQIRDATKLVAMELSDPLGADLPATAARLKGKLHMALDQVNLARLVWREQLAAERELAVAKQKFNQLLSGSLPQPGDVEAAE